MKGAVRRLLVAGLSRTHGVQAQRRWSLPAPCRSPCAWRRLRLHDANTSDYLLYSGSLQVLAASAVTARCRSNLTPSKPGWLVCNLIGSTVTLRHQSCYNRIRCIVPVIKWWPHLQNISDDELVRCKSPHKSHIQHGRCVCSITHITRHDRIQAFQATD